MIVKVKEVNFGKQRTNTNSVLWICVCVCVSYTNTVFVVPREKLSQLSLDMILLLYVDTV